MQFRARTILVTGVLAGLAAATPAPAQQYDQKLFSEMRWRCIGPFRGGRTVAITGVPHQPTVFYIAAVNGGVWKTTDTGNTWEPIFDGQASGSVGAIAVAPSDPNVIYVRSGRGLRRPRRRPLQIHRRRKHLAPANEGPAFFGRRQSRTHRCRGRAESPAPRVRPRGSKEGSRSLPFG